MKRIKLVTVVLFLSLFAKAQSDMQKGFTQLESGNFIEAKSFFKTYLEKDATNKTAQICYGRALGLSGETSKAIELFGNLLKTYPGDFEVAINYNESFLWDKNYTAAKPLYAQMVVDHPENFAAQLGYANTLSNLKDYEMALYWVEKALVLAPENPNAKRSRKYMYLGYANQYVNGQNFPQAKAILRKIFIDFPEDKDALLNLANIYLITKQLDSAKITYKRYVSGPKDEITALNGIALAEHIGQNEKEALKVAQLSKAKVAAYEDVELKERTYDRYVQALIWNRRFVKAKRQIDSLEKVFPKRDWIYALKATLGLYTGDTGNAVKNYKAILIKDSTSFDGNLGLANAFFAADQIVPAYKAAFKTLTYYPDQRDALGFLEKLDQMHSPHITQQAAYTFDNGYNEAYYTQTKAELPLSANFRTTLSYSYRNTENTVSGNKANSHVVMAGLQYKLFPKTLLKTVVGLNNSNFMEDAYTQPVLQTELQMQPFKLQHLNLGYQREVQNFNADLIEREILQHHYQLNYNLGTNINLGWYTQLMHTEQSDANTRDLLFTSLYYTLMQKPTLKMGVNYQYITFKDQVPDIYFSPETYSVAEIFADIRGNLSEKTSYVANMATGFQAVEEDPNTSIFRAEAQIQHQFSKRLSGKLYGKYSNIASATASGFEFTELGFSMQWRLLNKPVFYAKLSK